MEKHVYHAPKVHTSSYPVDSSWYMDTTANGHLAGEPEKMHVKEPYQGNDQVHADNGSDLRVYFMYVRKVWERTSCSQMPTTSLVPSSPRLSRSSESGLNPYASIWILNLQQAILAQPAIYMQNNGASREMTLEEQAGLVTAQAQHEVTLWRRLPIELAGRNVVKRKQRGKASTWSPPASIR